MPKQFNADKSYKDPIVGKRFGKLLVIRRLPDRKTGAKNVRAVVLCQCECGKRPEIPRYYLLRSNPKVHCGCDHINSLTKQFPGEYGSWTMMKARCYSEDHVSYAEYGGRGIRVCIEWLTNFEKFVEDMGIRPTPHHTLDRKDVNGNYTKDNCRWATATEQRANQRPRGEDGLSGEADAVHERVHREAVGGEQTPPGTDQPPKSTT